MRKFSVLAIFLMIGLVLTWTAQKDFSSDIFQTSAGDLKITFIGHATLMFTFSGKIIHVDPYKRVADYVRTSVLLLHPELPLTFHRASSIQLGLEHLGDLLSQADIAFLHRLPGRRNRCL